MEKDIKQYFTAIQQDYQKLDAKIGRLEEKVDKGFSQVNGRIDHLDQKMNSRFEQLETKFDDKLARLSDNVQVIAAMLQARQTEFIQLDRRVTRLEKART